MLKKILLSVVMIGISFLTGYAAAQSYFNNKAPAPGPVASNEPQENNVMSPSDFQSQTQQMQEKKNQALTNQLKEDLAKIPPTTPPPPPAAEPGVPGAPATGQVNTPETNQPTATNPSSSQPPIQEAEPSGPAPAAPPTSAPAQSQVYTGFQNQNQDQNQKQSPAPGTNQSQPSSSGGWNIKY